MEHISFPSIEQFRNVIKTVKACSGYNNILLPIIKFRGTVKLHGTNASIVYDSYKKIFYAQSRSNILSLINDNAGFCQFFETNKDFFETWIPSLQKDNTKRYVVVYGEWCGGNIQKGVAINGLPKMFVIFSVRECDIYFSEENIKDTVSDWYTSFDVPSNNINVYNINEFKTYNITIDFSCPEKSQNELVEITNLVEKECPIGMHFGNSGIGEGVVWSFESFDENFIKTIKDITPYKWCLDLIFKVKGEKHSVTKVKTLASVDVEVINNQKELINSLATENRFLQGLRVLNERGININDSKNTKDFINWVKDDIIKEEKDTILASGLDFGKIISGISNKFGQWFNTR